MYISLRSTSQLPSFLFLIYSKIFDPPLYELELCSLSKRFVCSLPFFSVSFLVLLFTFLTNPFHTYNVVYNIYSLIIRVV